jgi:hypothetical protein
MANHATTETGLRRLINKSREILSKETEILSEQNSRISSLISSLKSRTKSDHHQELVPGPFRAPETLVVLGPLLSAKKVSRRKKTGEISEINQAYESVGGRLVVPVTGRPMVIDESIIGAEDAAAVRRYIAQCPSGALSGNTAAWFRRYMYEFPNGPVAIRLGPKASAFMRRYESLKAARRRVTNIYRRRIRSQAVT